LDTNSPEVKPIEWRDGVLRMLDQTLLPAETRFIETRDYRDVAGAIKRLAVRGAPLIGIAAAYGIALAERARDEVRTAAEELATTRPTAVNLCWAIERVLAAAAGQREAEALRIHAEQIAADECMGELGAALIGPGSTLLTHCNTGALATGGSGTALGVIAMAHRQGNVARVLVDETRPLLQGARLTAWELQSHGVPYEIIVDAAAAGIIASGEVDAVLVGADRIAANGDVANKIGTYGLALAAHAHSVPFYVVAPASTIDPATPAGAAIIIEERDAAEVRTFAGGTIAPREARVRNPAFDVTPASLVTAIVTERGVLRPPYDAAIAWCLAESTQPVAVAP
jgi:methylthioribose-1-phosphate isomerase